MLDLGFEKDIESILEVLGSRDDNNRSRQHVLLSATLNERVEQLAALSLDNPATIGLEEAMPVEMDSLREVGNGSSRTQPEIQKHERSMGDAGPSDGYTEYKIPSQLVQSFLKGMLDYSILEDSVQSCVQGFSWSLGASGRLVLTMSFCLFCIQCLAVFD